MKLFTSAFVSIFGLAFSLSAGDGPIPMPAEARLHKATHVFTAKAVDAHIVDEHGKPRKPKPPWIVNGMGEAFEITLTKITPLFPTDWQPPKSIIIYYRANGAMTEYTTKPLLGRERIYFVRALPEKNRFEAFCVNFSDEIEHLPDVRAQIQ